ncbi:ankyrin repeat domain-containing protein, partial [Candidatus Ozemobacteraceae bacterium]|nr:ankyrin repeat domain-containing protein [Candidatus Ozemobacteraceae bacterium]
EGISKKRETALHLAAHDGKDDVVKLLLEAGANREARSEHGETPLHMAAADGHTSIMQMFLEAKADVNARTLAGETPLHLAAREGDIEVADLCLAHGANPEIEDNQGNNFLEIAVRAGKRDFLDHFSGLELHGPEAQEPSPQTGKNVRRTTAMPAVDLRDAQQRQGGRSPSGKPDAYKKPEANLEDHVWTKLVQAIERNDLETVQQLLSQEPDAALRHNYHHETLLHFAAGIGSLGIVNAFLEHGAKADAPDDYGWTPLHEACAQGHAEIVARFIATHANLEGVSKKHETALHLAAQHEVEPVVRLLLEAGANIEARNDHGETPLHGATAIGNRSIMQLLLEAGADVNARNLAGETPLHLAAQDGDVDVADLCLSFGANPKEEDKQGKNFIQVAVRAGKRPFLEHFANLDMKGYESQPGPAAASAGAAEEQQHKAARSRNIRPSIIMKVQDVVAGMIDPKRGMLNVFFLGSEKSGSWFLLELLDTLLWFFVFPFLIFVIWMGFHQKIIPGLVTFSGAGQAESLMLLLQTALNTLIVLVATSLLVETGKDSVPLPHYLHYLRENVRLRVIQFAVIDAFIINRLTVNDLFWQAFFPFWAGFMALYGVSFLAWWVETGGTAPAPKSRHTGLHKSA